MSKNPEKLRCIRENVKKDGTVMYHAEVRRKHAKPLRKTCRTLTAAKNWVKQTESALLEGREPQDTKAKKQTLNDLIDQYIRLYLSKYPKRLRDQSVQ